MIVDIAGKLKMLKELKKIIQSSQMKKMAHESQDGYEQDNDAESVSVVKVSKKPINNYEEDSSEQDSRDDSFGMKNFNDKNKKNKMNIQTEESDDDEYLKNKIMELFSGRC